MKVFTKILFFPLVFLLVCCEEYKDVSKIGYLKITGIELSCTGEIIPLTKAVDAGLQVQILQDGTLLEDRDYAPGADFSKRIVLSAGKNYTVEAFTPDQTEAENDEPGHPVFSVESTPFEVEEADITTISLVAPQINVGVGMSCEEAFVRDFTDISVTIISESGRSVTISGTDDLGYRYFTLPVSGKLNYTIQAVNKDGEVMQKTADLMVTAKNYRINLAIQ